MHVGKNKMGSIHSSKKKTESSGEKSKLATSVGSGKYEDEQKKQGKPKKTGLETKISGFEQRLRETIKKSGK